MFGNVCKVWALCPLVFCLVGCKSPDTLSMTDDQATKMDDAGGSVRAHFVAMVDNGLLHNMAVADMDFVPHTTELSGTGTARLDRLAPMLSTYGGMLRYETYLPDDAVVEARLAHVREYLGLVGCDMDRVTVAAVMSGGTGITASEAISIALEESKPVGVRRSQPTPFRGPRGETSGGSTD